MTPELFDATGYALIPDVLNPAECEAISDRIRSDTASGGTRRLLDNDWCMELAKRLRGSAAFSGLLDAAHVAVQCTYFEKSASRNWLVPIHQDLSIPVAQRVAEPTLSGWSEKEGSLYVQAPVALLEQLVAVRVHLDACSEEDGPLRVVPGSHRHGVIAAEASCRRVGPGQERNRTWGGRMVEGCSHTQRRAVACRKMRRVSRARRAPEAGRTTSSTMGASSPMPSSTTAAGWAISSSW